MLWKTADYLNPKLTEYRLAAMFTSSFMVEVPTANGLIFMQERALLLNGTFTIKSEIGKGTTVQVEVPV